MRIVPFKTPLWSFSLGDIQDSTIDKCYALEQQLPNIEMSNRGGYQSPNISLSATFPELYQNVCLLKSVIEDEAGFRLNITDAWLNINRKHSYNIEHIHPQSVFSGVIYLKVPADSGAVMFKNPTPVALFPAHHDSPLFTPYCSYQPNVGAVVFFPSYLPHFVEANKSDEARISIAFNTEPM
jgi:uncharacterized protein (TIGR02466 family)